MRERLALAALLTILMAAPLAAQPYSTGRPTPGSWAHSHSFYPSQDYFESMAYGGDGYWEYFGGGGCASCSPCGGPGWHGFFRKCTTVNGCPYWASDPCCRSLLSEMACDVKCFCSSMSCSNHTRMRAALCRALCQDCSACGSCYGCSSCGEHGCSYGGGYSPQAAPRDEHVDPFRDDVPQQGRGAYYSPYPAPTTREAYRDAGTTSVLRADHQEPLVAPKLPTPGREVSLAERRVTRGQSEAERLSQYQLAQRQAQGGVPSQAPSREQAQLAAQAQQLADQYALLQQQYQAQSQAQQATQAQTQYQAQLQAQQYVAQLYAMQNYVAQQQAAQQYAAQQAAQQQYAVQQQYAAQQAAAQQYAAQHLAAQQQAMQQQAMQQMAAQQYAAQQYAAQQAAARQAAAQAALYVPQPVAMPQLMTPPVAAPAPQFMTPPVAAPAPQVAPTVMYVPIAPPEAPRSLNGGTISASATSRTADTGVEMSILRR